MTGTRSEESYEEGGGTIGAIFPDPKRGESSRYGGGDCGMRRKSVSRTTRQGQLQTSDQAYKISRRKSESKRGGREDQRSAMVVGTRRKTHGNPGWRHGRLTRWLLTIASRACGMPELITNLLLSPVRPWSIHPRSVICSTRG